MALIKRQCRYAVSLLLCISLLCGSLASCKTAAVVDAGPEVYTVYDADAAEEALAGMKTLSSEPDSLKQIKEYYDVLIRQYDNLTTDYCVATILYYQNVFDDAVCENTSVCGSFLLHKLCNIRRSVAWLIQCG